MRSIYIAALSASILLGGCSSRDATIIIVVPVAAAYAGGKAVYKEISPDSPAPAPNQEPAKEELK